jgi:formiminoglutamate deiminase
VYGEMLLAGITAVGEFHYLHHAPSGRRYDDPNAMGEALIAAAAEAGIRITLLDACYLRGGIDQGLDEAQRRFADAGAAAWVERVDALADRYRADHPAARVGAAIHSVRAVDPESAAAVASWVSSRDRPLHAHVSEQPAENEACLAAYGRTPTEVLAEAGAIDAGLTAVHATHVTDPDVRLLGGGARCCLCPTTERDLADGVGPARRLADGGVPIALGTDSNALIDMLEEARAVELDERLRTGVRGHHSGAALLRAATDAGHASIGWPEGGRIAAGAIADLVTIGLDGHRLAGTTADAALDSVVFAGAAADVSEVMAGGRWIVREGAHADIDVAGELRAAIGALGP